MRQGYFSDNRQDVEQIQPSSNNILRAAFYDMHDESDNELIGGTRAQRSIRNQRLSRGRQLIRNDDVVELSSEEDDESFDDDKSNGAEESEEENDFDSFASEVIGGNRIRN